MITRSAKAMAGDLRLALFHAVLLCVTTMVLGCKPPPRPPIKSDSDTAQSAAEKAAEKTLAAPPPVAEEVNRIPLRYAIAAPFDVWDAYYFGGEQIGYSHTRAEPTDRKDEVRYTVTEHIESRRGDEVLRQVLKQTSIETLSGQLKRFEAELTTGGTRTAFTGQVTRGKLVIKTTREGETTERSIPWKATYGGLLARDQQLRENPLEPGETRSIEMLAPLFYQLGRVEIKANGTASVPMLSGDSEPLLECESNSSIAGNAMLEMFLWTDEKGQVLKSYAPSLQLTTLRVDELTATSFREPQQDLLAGTGVPLDKGIEAAAQLQRAGYHVIATGPVELPRVILPQPGQQTRVLPDGSLQVAVTAGVDAEFSGLAPSEEDRNPGPLVQSNDVLIKALAETASGNTPLEIASSLSQLTNTHMDSKDFSSGFASAAAAAASGQGDCTEYAVLLTALCRNRGIPARVVTGLVYAETPQGPEMRFHMWTLAHVGSGWIQLDATAANGIAPADRIALTTDTLASGAEYAAVAPVQQVLGKIRVVVAKTISAEGSLDQSPADGEEAVPANL